MVEHARDRYRLWLRGRDPLRNRRDVYTVERHGPLAEKAAATLADLGYDNVHVLHADGTVVGRNMRPSMDSCSRGWSDDT